MPTDTTIIDRLRQRVDRLMESARIVSNSGKPESDNEFGRDATLLHNAADALTAAHAELAIVRAERDQAREDRDIAKGKRNALSRENNQLRAKLRLHNLW